LVQRNKREMSNRAQFAEFGYKCPVRGCPKKNNSRFSLGGLCKHLMVMHPGYLEKKLNVKQEHKK